ncbi:MAG: type III-B CRISPR module-associated protein Cmr5 [Thiolinea sp.]
MQTIQQQRAKYALDEVKAALDRGVNKKEYKSYASSLPAMIHMNGLGQAAAFFKSKGGTHRELYNLLSGWLTQANQPYVGKDLLEGITTENMHAYRLAQAEAQALMDWVKKFAKAFMITEEDAQ